MGAWLLHNCFDLVTLKGRGDANWQFSLLPLWFLLSWSELSQSPVYIETSCTCLAGKLEGKLSGKYSWEFANLPP